MEMKCELYSDAGNVGKNPSPFITWSWCLIEDDQLVKSNSGFVDGKGKLLSNNVAEMIALILAFESIPKEWEGTFYCDSEITLWRTFRNWKLNNLPSNVVRRLREIKTKFNIGTPDCKIIPIAVAGHPTKQNLRDSFKIKDGKKYPVSRWNVFCDKECNRQADIIKTKLGI